MNLIYALPLLFILTFPSAAICKDLEGTFYDKSHHETGHWRYDSGTKEIVIFDDLYRETGRIKKNNYGGFKVYDDEYRKIGKIKGEEKKR